MLKNSRRDSRDNRNSRDNRDNPKKTQKYGSRPFGNKGQDRSFSKGEPRGTSREFGRKDNDGFKRESGREFGGRDRDGFKRSSSREFNKSDRANRFDKDRKDNYDRADRFDRKDSGGFKRGTSGARGPKKEFGSKFTDKFEKRTPNNKFAGKPANARDMGPNKFTRADNYRKKADTITTTTSAKISPIAASDEESGMVYGRNAVLELLRSGKTVDKLFVQSGQREGSVTMIVAEAIKLSIPIIEADKKKLDFMINHASHQGVVALASQKEYCSIDDILDIAEERGQTPFILVADKIMDAHNLGAIIRSAECAGVHGIIIPKRNAVGVSPIVVKASAGAAVHMAIAKVANISTALNELKEKGVWVFSAVAANASDNDNNDGQSCTPYSDADYTVAAALVVGNEGEGLSPIIIKNSDFLVTIPMFGKIESLNVSCASAILLYEAAKQRNTAIDSE